MRARKTTWTVAINYISFNLVRLETDLKKVKNYKPALSQTEEQLSDSQL